MVIKITLNDFIGKVIRLNHTNIENFDSNIKLVWKEHQEKMIMINVDVLRK